MRDVLVCAVLVRLDVGAQDPLTLSHVISDSTHRLQCITVEALRVRELPEVVLRVELYRDARRQVVLVVVDDLNNRWAIRVVSRTV